MQPATHTFIAGSLIGAATCNLRGAFTHPDIAAVVIAAYLFAALNLRMAFVGWRCSGGSRR